MQIDELLADPIEQFEQWFEQALKSESSDAAAFSLATATEAGKPSARILLYKGVTAHHGENVPTFFTNSNSAKGQDLANNPQAEMLFYWPTCYRQVRVSGYIVALSADVSAKYFSMRSRASQLSSLASNQSQEVGGRDELLLRVKELESKYAGAELPCPDYWQGYALIPSRFEFWVGRDHRLHDRFCYTRDELGSAGWSIVCLAP